MYRDQSETMTDRLIKLNEKSLDIITGSANAWRQARCAMRAWRFVAIAALIAMVGLSVYAHRLETRVEVAEEALAQCPGGTE